ncbi:MAG: bifunctional hydroxymethylpyrimidine kinase/phosphomethylpyrimidine kinase [Rhodospirillaceae bacterium]|nr:bifunctional hydroxymethylpyrimidine kinase/phosphomethylpyrimidine kinase [Rhodospirillaceae bacterium]
MSALELRGRVLVVAGSDSGGGAGIQADIKTVTALGGYAATAITAITDQNTKGVHGVQPVAPQFVSSQIESILTDIGADITKTGMLGSGEVINAIAAALDKWGLNIPRVVDPVMVAKGGHSLITDDAVAFLKNRLVSGATVVTPNLPEAEVLTGLKVKTVADMEAAASHLQKLGAQAVLLKGGHLEGDHIVDMLITEDQIQTFESSRIHSTSTHGTGCTLASGIATSLAQGLSLVDSVERARNFVITAIETAPGLGKGHGPLNHGHTMRPVLRKEIVRPI